MGGEQGLGRGVGRVWVEGGRGVVAESHGRVVLRGLSTATTHTSLEGVGYRDRWVTTASWGPSFPPPTSLTATVRRENGNND